MKSINFAGRTLIAALLVTALLGAEVAQNPIVIDGTKQGSLGVPRVYMQLRDGKRPLTAEPTLLDMDSERVDSFLAYLDTGASGYVMSPGTLERFGAEVQKNAQYIEVGLHGQQPMGVTRDYTIALAGVSGGIDAGRPHDFDVVQKEVALLVRSASQGELGALLGEMNVVGMPAIRELVIEIDPEPMRGEGIEAFGAGPDVILHSSNRRPRGVDVEIPMEYIDFNLRNHPDNRGSLPELTANPMIMGVETNHAGSDYKGDWLLDTGAMASIISVKHAQALGLYDANGQPARAPEFTLPLGDIGGNVQPSHGFVIERMRINGRGGKQLEFRNVSVVVKDVGTKLNNGQDVILDGILGMNLLLPSASGLTNLVGMQRDGGAFDRIWIDGPRGVLALELK